MASHGQIYKNISGTVIEIVNRYKAILEINGPDSKQRAMLRVEKLTCKSDINPDGSEDHAISDFVKVGYVLRCRCHKYSETEDHNCAWFIAEVLSIHHEMADPQMLTGLCPNMVNKIGCISHLDKRQGVISIKENESEIHHDVLFLASKVYDGGKRIKVKHPLHEYVSINDKVNFDAVPINPEENDNNCAWFATLVWKKSKPLIDYNSASKEPDPNLGKIKTIIKNPHSQFIRGKGQILQILSEEYGVALGAVNDKQNHWQSLLFHRSCASLFKFNLGKTNLQEVFKEGDKIRFIAALAPKGFSAQWVASHVSVDVVGEARSLVESI